MYNLETKEAFLKTLPTPELVSMYTSLFTRGQAYEHMLDKDILLFNARECVNLLCAMEPKSIKQVSSLISQFSKYTNWGKQTSLVKDNFWLLVPPDDTSVRLAFAGRYVKDLTSLETIVEKALHVPDDKYVIYLLYMGIMGKEFKELTSITDADINMTARTVTTDRGSFNMVAPLLSTIQHGIVNEKEAKQRDEESEYFIKPYKTKRLLGNPASYQHIHRVVTKLNQGYNETNPSNLIHLTPMTIWRSGLFNELWQVEQVRGNITSDDFAMVSEVYDNKNSYASYLKDYELYKDIFWGISRK